MKIAIFGGSFNPVHNGHIEIVKYALENLELDLILVIPVGRPSHKNYDLENANDRYEMCRLAFDGIKKVEVLDIETKDKNISYTYDTLVKIRDLYGNENEYYEIIGYDSALYFDKWKNFKEIIKLSKIIVFLRYDIKDIIKDENFIYLNNPLYKISSTEIREKIKNNENIEKYVNKKVLEYIEENKLYR